MLFASSLSLSLYLISRRLISGIQIIDVRFLCVQNYSDRFIIMVWSVLSFLFFLPVSCHNYFVNFRVFFR
jgi:hypothetical protein